jgi:hypothetical protein
MIVRKDQADSGPSTVSRNAAFADIPEVTFLRTCLAGLAVAAATAVPAAATTTAITPMSYATTSTPVVDTTATARLHALADGTRADNGQQKLFTRGGYVTAANRMATQLAQGQTVVPPGDDSPVSYLGGTTIPLWYDAVVEQAMQSVVSVAHAVLAYPMHTDGGWSVVSRRLSNGDIAWGVALVVGWPNPNVSTPSGCSAAGYCWTNGGLNPHLPWTRNTVKWYLSTSHLPAAGESLVKTAIANMNRIAHVGADIRYGGKTTATSPDATHRFLIVWGSCGSSSALACTTDSTQGTYDLIYQAKMTVSAARYAANPSTTWWLGTLMHEVGHGTGLGHFNGTYLGSYQLMRWADGPDVVKTGDANGMRAVTHPGRISASIRWRASDGALIVRTASSSLGGIRSIRSQCTDSSGVVRTIKAIAGTWDITTADHAAGTFLPPSGSSRRCRAVVTSKSASYTTPSIVVTR